MMRYLYYMVLVMLIGGCSKNDYDMNDFYSMYGASEADAGESLRTVSAMNIFFGHQSVGANILSGIEQWEQETGVTLNTIETRTPDDSQQPAFAHYRVGRNGDPVLKIDDFVSQVENLPAESGAVAFFKLCYVDITGSTDTDELFEYYKEKMLYLREQRPDCRVVLFTVPLTTIQKGIKATAKKILNREPSGVLENVKRNEFNDRLRSEFAGIIPVFDLAALESTLPDDSRETYKYQGNEYPCMVDFYTGDGGHLNEYGARMVSRNLLAFLAGEFD